MSERFCGLDLARISAPLGVTDSRASLHSNCRESQSASRILRLMIPVLVVFFASYLPPRSQMELEYPVP